MREDIDLFLDCPPFLTVPLTVVERDVDPADSNPLRFDTSRFPVGGGVYVIRFEKKVIRRLIGESRILRIGFTKDYRSRFSKYGATDVLGDLNVSLAENLQGRPKDMANRVVVFALLRLLQLFPDERIVVDFYTNASEGELLNRFVNCHLETPPLNFTLRSDS